MRIEYDKDGNPIVHRDGISENPDFNKKTPNRFYHIPYLKDKLLDAFSPDVEVWIEEKIDGTNISCEIDDDSAFRCYGKNYELGDWYTNRGAYQKLLEIEPNIRKNLPRTYILYFEYLTLHHVRYSADKENGIYLIGVKDKITEKYLLPNEVYDIADKIGVETPACLYHGAFINWSVAEKLVGTSKFGAEQGEGVIVKSFDKRNGIKMVKIVASDFREIMKYDPARVQAKLDAERSKRELAATIVTPARIRKQLYTLVDEGIIPCVDGMSHDDKVIAIKNIGKLIYYDCIKEEPEFVVNFGNDFGRYSFMLSKAFIEQL